MVRRLSALIFLALFASQSRADDSLFWKNVGDWEISIDTTLSNGCYAVANWAGGTVLRIGEDPGNGGFYFLIGNTDWTALEPSGSYDLKIQFDNRLSWNVSAKGLQFNPDEQVFLFAQSQNREFVQEFRRANKMKISYQGKVIETLKLVGSNRAFSEIQTCQRYVDANGLKKQKDPFAE